MLNRFMDKVRYASWSGMRAVAMALYETLRSEYGHYWLRPRARISVRNPAASLIEAAEEANPERTFIAVGSRALGVVQRLRLGNVSTKVLRASKGPVLVVTLGPNDRRFVLQHPATRPLTLPASESNIHTS